MKRLLTTILIASTASCASTGTDSEESARADSRLVLAELDRCGDLRFDTLPNVCADGNVSTHYLADPATSRRLVFAGQPTGVELVNDGSGNFSGEVRFVSSAAGEYAIYLGTPNVEFDVTKVGGTPVSLTCSRYVGDFATGCTWYKGAYVVSLESYTEYRFRFGPGTNAWTRLQVERRSEAGRIARNVRRDCSAVELATLSGVCSDVGLSTPTPINGAELGAPGTGVSLGTAYGVHLPKVGGAFEGALSFVPPYTSDYMVYLSSPNLPIATYAQGGVRVEPECAEWVSDDLATSVTGSTCTPLRAGYRLPALQGGVAQRIELGRSADTDWVRAVVVPTSPDTDGDGTADELDGCPTDPALTVDEDNDGLCGALDPCPADYDNVADGDGICSSVDNCPGSSNPDQADLDGDLRGDACDLSSSMVLADLTRCGAARLDGLAAACTAGATPVPITSRPLNLSSGNSAQIFTERAYGVHLHASARGNGGSLLFRSAAAGEYVFYLGTPNVPFDVTERGTNLPAPRVCSQFIGGALEGSCAEFKGAYVVTLAANREYDITLGTLSPQSWTRLFVTKRAESGRILAHLASCSEPQLESLEQACPIASSTTAINAGTLGEPSPASLSVHTAYGVHLQSVAGDLEGAFSFTPPYTSDYVVHLGTPNVPMAMTLNGDVQPAVCGSYISDAVATAVTGAACTPLRGVHRFSALAGGEVHRLELGPTPSGESWVRLIIEPTDPDTDGDGVSDPLDVCPTDPTATIDSDGDGLCGAEDACPNDANNDVDADGLCGDVDNCKVVSNPGQADGDADGIGDACDDCVGPGLDPDHDLLCDGSDNCPSEANPGQEDADADGRGDPCDTELDLVLLQDLTGSHSGYFSAIRSAIPALYAGVNACLASRFGVGSFIDKPFSPHGAPGEYSYRADLPLTEDLPTLVSAYGDLVSKVGGDGGESQLTALLHASHDGLPFYGFSGGARKVVLLFTDGAYHIPGECSAASCTSGPNDGDSVLEEREDYPSPLQVAASLQANGLEVIFVVTEGELGRYQALLTTLGVPGRVVTLTYDPTQIVAAVRTALGC